MAMVTPGLPLVELQQLKEEVRRHYPKYWNSPIVNVAWYTSRNFETPNRDTSIPSSFSNSLDIVYGLKPFEE